MDLLKQQKKKAFFYDKWLKRQKVTPEKALYCIILFGRAYTFFFLLRHHQLTILQIIVDLQIQNLILFRAFFRYSIHQMLQTVLQ